MSAVFSEEKIKKGFKDLDQKNSEIIKDLIKNGGISKTKLPEKGGVYIFWWNQSKAFEEKLKGCTYQVKAKKSHEVNRIDIRFTKEWIDKATVGNKICLYVGRMLDYKGVNIIIELSKKSQNEFNDAILTDSL